MSPSDSHDSSKTPPDALLCAVALHPECMSRNQYFWVYAEIRARRAHANAHFLRRLSQQLDSVLRQNTRVTIDTKERGMRIVYRDEALTLTRRIHLAPLEAALLRVLLSQKNTPVPKSLNVTENDLRSIDTALRKLKNNPELPAFHDIWGNMTSLAKE